jgi:hypothetical protein
MSMYFDDEGEGSGGDEAERPVEAEPWYCVIIAVLLCPISNNPGNVRESGRP